MTAKYTIGVVGNPNCGKTTLFNALTGAKQRVGNWPGVTVERKVGQYLFEGAEYELVDLPGTYSLEVVDGDVSLDEQIARDYVVAREADLIINLVDASNLERNLYLTSQLLEMKVPMLVALNMMDAAEEEGVVIDVPALAAALGCPVLPVVAANGRGVDELKAAMAAAAQNPTVSPVEVPYKEPVEQAVAQLLPAIADKALENNVNPRWLAVRLLEGDELARDLVDDTIGDRLPADQQALEEALGDDIDISLADARYSFVNAVSSGAVTRKGRASRVVSDRIDRVVLNRALGIPIFLFAMYLMFMFTINIGGAFVDAFDMISGAIVVDGFGALLGSLGAPDWLVALLADGLGGGVQVVATFVPIVGFLFLFLSFLEDSGYMARAAFVMDRFLRSIGLPGKSFVPMIVGFGCTVPAIMATRTLESDRDRKITIAMSPFMSCGARLPVYALFAAAFFASSGQAVVFALYLTGIVVAVLTGLVLKTTLLRGDVTPFVMELPPYHMPTLKGVSLRTWERTRGFVVRAGRVIVPMVLALNMLNSVGTDGSFGHENSNKSVLSEVGRTISPLFSPFGLDQENWPASVGIFTGLMAKEAVVGTLDSLYSSLGDDGASAALEPGTARQGVIDKIGAGFASIPANLADVLKGWADPLGIGVGDLSSQQAAAADQEVDAGTFGAMLTRFDGGVGAFAYLLFILLYMPCFAATAAVRRESSARWTAFVISWTTGTAYVGATLFYQAATFAAHPGSSTVWLVSIAVFVVSVLTAMRVYGQRSRGRAAMAVAE